MNTAAINTTPVVKTCQGKTTKGADCKNKAVNGFDFCFCHGAVRDTAAPVAVKAPKVRKARVVKVADEWKQVTQEWMRGFKVAVIVKKPVVKKHVVTKKEWKQATREFMKSYQFDLPKIKRTRKIVSKKDWHKATREFMKSYQFVDLPKIKRTQKSKTADVRVINNTDPVITA